MNILKVAIRAALEAGEAINKIYEEEDFEIDFKADDSPLTQADKAAHRIIEHHLRRTDIPILSEEGRLIPFSERKNWKRLWIVDPLDGTKEFIKRNGEFTVNIALVEDGTPVLGVIFVPVLGELYFSEKAIGSFKAIDIDFNDDTDKLISDALPLPLSHVRKQFTVVASRSHMSPETAAYIDEMRVRHGEIELISKGSSLKICMVAEGRADCYPRFAPTMEWDTAAGHAIATGSACSFTDRVSKQEMKYNREELLNNWFLVSRNA